MPRLLAITAFTCLLSPFATYAYTVGHARVVSANDQPLVVTIPLRDLSDSDVTQLSAKVSAPSLWQVAGLKPPVNLETLQIEVLPSITNDPSQRLLKVSSTQRAQGNVIDLLIEVVTPTGVKPLQASVIVLAAPSVATPGGQSIVIQRGDNLWFIAEKYPTAGANIYQTLLAIFQENPKAFIDQNMNLLKTGASLKLPSAASVLAINAAEAQKIFNQHLQAFNARHSGQVVQKVQKLTVAPNATQSKGKVDQPVKEKVELTNEVRLASQDIATQQADQATSVKRQADDEKSRIQALEDTLSALKKLNEQVAGSMSA
ncbi:MAG: hypothetical protein NWS57_08460, partial [Burkholderiaceae bacterium]|nr:hypothetical protein [Burkholderiaceae bacterium]